MGYAMSIKSALPKIFCLENVQCTAKDTGGYNYHAALYHDQACMLVSFDSAERDTRLKDGEFVSVRWLHHTQSDHGAIQVAGLTLLSAAGKKVHPRNFNPFLIVPHTWHVDRHLINCARDMWDISSREMRRMMFTTVLTKAGYAKWQKHACAFL